MILNITARAHTRRPYRFLIETRPFAVALLATEEAFVGHPWVFTRLRGPWRRWMAAIPLTRRTHLFVGVCL